MDDKIDTITNKFAGVECLNTKNGSKLLSQMILSGKSFLAARVGETELGTIRCYSHPFKNLRDFRLYSNTICINAGFFPKNIFAIKGFSRIYKKSLNNIDYYGFFGWKDEEKYISGSKNLKICYPAEVYDALIDDVSWYEALRGKNVLVVHPFAETIKGQYKKRDILFPADSGILPEFNLIVYKSVQSIGGEGAKGYRTWFEALKHMKKDIKEIDFDIALLACGAYGVPLASYIKNMGKQAVYVGGCLQLLFGIIGKRWENCEYVMRYVNDHWVHPLPEETAILSNKVEDGCYW